MNIQYEKITIQDLDQMAEIYTRYLNSGENIHEYVEEGMRDPGVVGYKAVDHGEVVGVLTGRSGIDFTYPHPELEQRLREQFPEEKIYTPDALVVKDEYRGHPFAFELGRRLIRDVYALGYEYLLTELWIYPNGHIPAEHIVKDWGPIVFQEDIAGFYSDLETYHMTCPVCGTHCTCGARILVVQTDGTLHIQKGGEHHAE